MRVSSDKVFAEGTEVTADDREVKVGFEIGPELKAVLQQAIAGCERGEKISANQLLSELQSNE